MANYIYELPKIGSKTGFALARWVLDNWQISGITSLVSGAPFTPGFTTTDGQDITGSSEGPRITLIGDPRLDKEFPGLDITARFTPADQQVNPTFGAYTAARSPRIIQFSARVVF